MVTDRLRTPTGHLRGDCGLGRRSVIRGRGYSSDVNSIGRKRSKIFQNVTVRSTINYFSLHRDNILLSNTLGVYEYFRGTVAYLKIQPYINYTGKKVIFKVK